jgi:hypothetical protein
MMHGFLTFCCVSRFEVFAKNVSDFAENVSVYFFRRPRRPSRLFHIIYCFIGLKPASTIFPPNCHSNSRFGVPKVFGNLAVRPLNHLQGYDHVVLLLALIKLDYNLTSTSWPSSSGLRGRSRTYLNILERAWSAHSKMVR